MAASDAAPVVVKVGGSLYDLPRLGYRLSAWLERLEAPRVLLVPGGGVTANAIRALDRWQGLGEEQAHWLALRSLTVNAHFLARILPPGSCLVSDTTISWPRTAILDGHAFCQRDEGQPGALPHHWSATSDALAARAAIVCGAKRLILLKSVPEAAEMDAQTEDDWLKLWATAAEAGRVDAIFGSMVAGTNLRVEWVNFRTWQP